MSRTLPAAIRIGAAGVAAVLATAVVPSTFGAAAPPGVRAGASVVAQHTVANGSPAGAALAGRTDASVVARHKVTLLTGDVVELTRFAGGRQAATVHPPADRSDVGYSTQQVGEDLYVIPNDAAPLLATGTLSRDLFDVTKLVAAGYDDAKAASVPMIVQYRANRIRAQAAPTLPGSSRGAILQSINAVGVQGSKRRAHTFWSSLSGNTAKQLGNIKRVWLDDRVKADLHESVPQIGAPQAWAAGYDGTGVDVAVIDTGIDASHPDFAGKIAAKQNFVPAGAPGGGDPTDVTDRVGHGTHVASIIAGSGAADDGQHKGVAPGAGLIVGKVFDNNGNGTTSAVIDAMEWATQTQHARVVNMSLGSNQPSDGTDPLSQAVNDLTAQTGALFVIAAGNAGPGEMTVASPGAADAALTVGAVDKSDHLADLSSRGPRSGDYAIKPEIAAPGIGIVAARASGTPLGDADPVGENYARLSGTSMATPHVAGAAAILAQEHPDWAAAQLKPALISTSKDDGYSVYQQGAGRLDVTRAFSQQVYADPGTLSLGYFRFPHTAQAPVTKPVTFRNNSSADVTLNLSLDVAGQKNGAPPAGMFTVSRPEVTVPAHGSAAVTVTIDPNAGQFDLYSGDLTGTAGDIEVRTSIGAYVEPEMYNVTVPAIAHDGRPASSLSQVELYNPTLPGISGTHFQIQNYFNGVTPTFRVEPGTYSLMGYIFTMDESNVFYRSMALLGRPQLQVTGDMTITLDARPAQKLVINTPKPSTSDGMQVGYHRKLSPDTNFDSSFTLRAPFDQVYAVPTAPVADGEFEVYSRWTLVAPPIQMSVTKPQKMPLDPLFMINSAPVDGTFRQPLVYVGQGAPEDYAGRDMHGKIALIQRGTNTPSSQIQNAQNAGAAAAVIFNNAPGLLYTQAGDPGTVRIPALTINQEAGQSLVNLLQKQPVTIQYSGTSQSPYLYSLMLPNTGRIAPNQTYDINSKNTAQIDAAYHADGPNQRGSDDYIAWRPWTRFGYAVARPLPHPMRRTEWVTASPDTQWTHTAWSQPVGNGQSEGLATAYRPGSRTAENWFTQPARPAIPIGLTGWEDYGAPASREGDAFTILLFPYVDSEQHHGFPAYGTDTTDTKLYQGTELLGQSNGPLNQFPAVPGPATYRLVSNQQRKAPWWTYATDVSTTWTFHSSTPASGRQLLPLVQVNYNLPLDLLNRAPSRTSYNFTLDVGHQAGIDGPAITAVHAWASFNDGTNWQPISLVQTPSGQLRATVHHPAKADSDGAVSLRVTATDADGNSIDQTIRHAYGLNP